MSFKGRENLHLPFLIFAMHLDWYISWIVLIHSKWINRDFYRHGRQYVICNRSWWAFKKSWLDFVVRLKSLLLHKIFLWIIFFYQDRWFISGSNLKIQIYFLPTFLKGYSSCFYIFKVHNGLLNNLKLHSTLNLMN